MAKNGAGRWIKRAFVVLLVAAAGAGGYYYLKKDKNPATEYQTAAVTRGNLTQAVTATGQLNPVLNVQVGSQISGIIRKLNVDFNSVVKSNQIIAEIDPSTYQMNVLRAEAQLANSKANLNLAEVQARRAKTLFAEKLISAAEYDIAMAQSEQAQAVVQSDEAALRNAKVQLSYCTISAPVDGVVISRNVDVGQTVAASFNTPTLFIIANDLTKMQIDALVSEADIGGVEVAQDVRFTVDAHPYRTFEGRVNQIRYGAITNQNVVNYDCVISVDNPDLKLLPGMTANVSIITAEREDALKIPNAALRYRPPEAPGATNTARTFTGSPSGGGLGGQMRQAGTAAGAGGPSGQGAAGRSPGGMLRGGGGGQGDGLMGSFPGGRQRVERQSTRTVYVLSPGKLATGKQPEPQPVPIKIGISDGISTEVVEGLEEGAQVVIGAITPNEPSGASRPGGSPFGGGPFRRF